MKVKELKNLLSKISDDTEIGLQEYTSEWGTDYFLGYSTSESKSFEQTCCLEIIDSVYVGY